MELKTLTDRTFELFGITEPSQLGDALMDACRDTEKLQAFNDLVEGDLNTDWMQRIYQYYLADRKDKKQDFTPGSLARFMGMLAGESKTIVDMCAGTGALIIQKWAMNHETRFIAIEYDEDLIPFLCFNMVLRNINCLIKWMDAIGEQELLGSWQIKKGEKYGNIVNIKSAL